MYRIKASTLVIAIFLFSFAWRGSLGEGREKVAKLENLAVVSATGVSTSTVEWYLGMEKGIFQKEGINLEIMPAKGLIRNAALKAGNVSYGITGPDAVWQVAAGFPTKLIFFSGSKRPDFLVTKPDIKDPRALKGKVIGVGSVGDSEHMAIEEIGKQFGLAPGDITVLSVGTGMIKLQALMAGSVDGVLVSIPINFLAEDKGFKTLLNVFDYFPVIGMILVARDETIKNNRDQVKRMVRASLHSHLYVLGNKEEVVDFLVRNTSVPRSMAARAYDAYRVNWTPNGLVEEAAIQREFDIGRRMGRPIPKTVTPSQLIDLSILKEVHKELGIR